MLVFFAVPPPVVTYAVLDSLSAAPTNFKESVATYTCVEEMHLLAGSAQLMLGEGDTEWTGSFTCGGM